MPNTMHLCHNPLQLCVLQGVDQATLHGCCIWSLTPKQERRWMVFDSMLLQTGFGPKRETT